MVRVEEKGKSHRLGVENASAENRLWSAMRSRFLPHATFWLVAWPLSSILVAAVALREQPLTENMPWRFALAGLSAGWLHLLPEFMGLGLVLCAVTLAVFAAAIRARQRPWPVRFIEPALAWSALSLGTALEFPALLHYPLLMLVRGLHVWQGYAVIFLLLMIFGALLGYGSTRHREKFLYMSVAASFVLTGWAMCFLPTVATGRAGSNAIVVMGIDSLSLSDDVDILRQFSHDLGGVFYEQAVTPGLLTNGVWPAIIMHRPVHDAGVMLTYQMPDWSRSTFHLVKEAEKHGYDTWSFFSDQFTTHVGSYGSFQHDRSGPVGWLQMATFELKDASVLLPLLLPRLPPIPFAMTPRNQASTYAYDLRAELLEVLTARSGSRPPLVVTHNDYLHQAAYPRFAELTSKERHAVLRAGIWSVQDLSAHWQYPEVPGDPLGLYRWKVRRIQQVIAEEAASTGFLDPAKHNRLVLFADHGNRAGLTNENFGQPKFYRVPLVTFGVSSRNPQAAISVLDIPLLLGFADPSSPQPADPVVEYANIDTQPEWNDAIVTAKLERDGRLVMRPEIIARWQQRLMAYRPYGQRGYFAARVRSDVAQQNSAVRSH